MTSTPIQKAKVFLLAMSDGPTRSSIAHQIKEYFSDSKIYFASDSMDTLFKCDNDRPHVLILDLDLPKGGGSEVIAKLFGDKKSAPLAVIVNARIPDTESFVDEVVTNQVQFYNSDAETDIMPFITKALNFLAGGQGGQYSMRHLLADEVLFKEGERGDTAYIVKRGRLKAIKLINGSSKLIGHITAGEFVGEMAHINGEPRSATVIAETHCELIELPFGSLDVALFSRPAWSKALISNLSQRLKRSLAQ